MIETAAPPRKGDLTRERCLKEARGLMAGVQRRLSTIANEKLSRTVIIEIISADGVISAIEHESRRAIPQEGGLDPDELLAEIVDALPELALQNCHKTLKIEIVSIKGLMSAIDTESKRHRWDK